MVNWQIQLATLAHEALYAELTAYPKAGLVSLVDSGSHRDMDSQTFLASIAALDDYWRQISQLGAKGATFTELVNAGKAAEVAMLQTTRGVNTHRGAVFILGILVAAVSYASAQGLPFSSLSWLIQERWGKEILAHRTLQQSHGNSVRTRYPDLAGDILWDAGHGFLALFHDFLPQLKLLQRSEIAEFAALETFYRIMAVTADNNLLYRGGEVGLKFAQQSATEFIQRGGVKQEGWLTNLTRLHHEFIAKNLSPGGSADLLAATIFLDLAEKELWD